MKTLKLIARSLMLASLIMLLAIADPPVGAQTGPNAASIAGIVVDTDREFRGAFKGVSYKVSYEALKVSSSLASVRLIVPVLGSVPGGELVLDAQAHFTEDGKKEVVIIDGHGKALSVVGKLALTAFAAWLEGYLHAYEGDLPPHLDLLVRSSLYWAEAPVGVRLERQEVRP